ncbi:putative ABC transport system permease protein [Trueperella bonasi]|uniref:ABC transport system permease protein n=1 Tax=Trueperella bonasi TaxID=312286 RepID=A0ABT9NHD4_9ACTO|nr:FtsX-like permease family protein [Trueperella bonasi]MDP9806814.1 putative ABC transport system permease protein [Trueperella bonasi]
MWKVTLRDIRENFARFLMSVAAVSIGVAFLTGTLSMRDLLGATFSNLTGATITADLYVAGPQLTPPAYMTYGEMTDDDLTTIRNTRGVEFAFPTRSANAYVYDDAGTAANVAQAPALGFNFVPEVNEDLLNEGRAPERGEIAIEESTSIRSGIEVGDTVVVYVNEPVEMDVVGKFAFGTGMAGASVVMMNDAEFVELVGTAFTEVSVTVEDGADPAVVKNALVQAVPDDYVVESAAEKKEVIDEAIAGPLNLVNTFLLVFVVIALAISTFIISNTFTISVRQRQRQFALLRAIGARPGQVFVAVILQAGVIGIIGSLVGVVFGQGLLSLIRAGLESAGMPMDGNLVVTGKTAGISILVGVIVTLLATIVPSRRAALTAPIEAMREGSGSAEKPLRRRTIISAIALVSGGALLAYGATNDSGGAFGGGAALLLLGVIGIMPGLVAPATTALGWLFRKISPATGVVASRSLVASPRKTASTAVALAIGVALVSAGSSLAASIRETMWQDLDDNFEADVLLMANGLVQDTSAATSLVEAVDGVAHVDDSMLNGTALLVAVDGEPRENIFKTGALSSHAMEGIGLVYKEGSSAAIDNGQAAIYDQVAEAVGAEQGSVIQLATETEMVEIEVGAIVESGTLTFSNALIMLPPDVAERLDLINPWKPIVVVDLEEGADSARAVEDIRLALKDQYVWTVEEREGLWGIANSQVDGVLTFLYGLLGLSVIIAVLGVVNTLSLSVVDRVREIGLLRAVGMQRSGVRRMVVQESIIITLFATVVGIVLGVTLGLALTRYLASDSEAFYVIPWQAMGTVLVVGLVVGVFAALLPARKAARLDVLDAIAEE